MTIIDTLLSDIPADYRVTDVYVGENWILSLALSEEGTQRAGVATTPLQIAADSRFQIGHYALNEDAQIVANLLRSDDATSAAVGLATLNALTQPDTFTTIDAADWLSAQSKGRSVAVFGRFPFIDAEIRPFARRVWVFEQAPQADEHSLNDLADILPQAEFVAITGSTLINHTLELILPHAKPDSIVALLGPSTPLFPKLFDNGISALFGVRVADVQQVIASVAAGSGFQKMSGLQRISLFKTPPR